MFFLLKFTIVLGIENVCDLKMYNDPIVFQIFKTKINMCVYYKKFYFI